jgi:uncharacterized protein YecT (DUF1311 family)
MRKQIGVGTLFLAFLVFFSPLRQTVAQSQTSESVAFITRCLDQEWKEGTYGDRCYGGFTEACLASPERKGFAGRVECLALEYRAWNELLDSLNKRIAVSLPSNIRGKFDKAHRAWIDSRKLSCEFHWDYVGRGVARAAVENCFARETANRVLYLESITRAK